MDSWDPDAALTYAEAAYEAGVAVPTVRMWASRGWLAPDGARRRLTRVVDGLGTVRVRLGDVLAAERATRRSGKSHRRILPEAA